MHEAVFMRGYRLFLTDIVETIDEIEEFTSGMDFTEFLNDRKTQKAVVRISRLLVKLLRMCRMR
jgi:uncharacterized protein with HEPN domain